MIVHFILVLDTDILLSIFTLLQIVTSLLRVVCVAATHLLFQIKEICLLVTMIEHICMHLSLLIIIVLLLFLLIYLTFFNVTFRSILMIWCSSQPLIMISNHLILCNVSNARSNTTFVRIIVVHNLVKIDLLKFK